MSAATGAPKRKGNLTSWVPGQSGNPLGRKLGSRNKLSEAFLKALASDFEEHGLSAIEECRTKKPEHYLKVIASMLPRNLELDIAVGPSTELKLALSEFAQDYQAVRDAMQRIGVNPIMIEAVTIDDE